ncbi:MAG: hypothetical protein CMJ88_14235 [Planctomycetes bacterium]|nr:hypothetical protein [Planctomycetota bacterium]
MAPPPKSNAVFCAWQAACSGPFVTNNDTKMDVPTSNTEFYSEQKWCDQCQSYVRFLMSINHSYCIDCGGRVRLFSGDDKRSFQDTVQRHKWQAS